MKHNSFISSSKFVYFKRIVSIFIFIVLLCFCLFSLQSLTSRKETILSHKSYYDSPERYDVVFLGTSHVMDGISPYEIWDESGITSYNLSSPSCPLPTTYWKLICLLDYSTPKMVVVDCYRATYENKSHDEGTLHQAFDPFRLSYHKYLAVKDLMRGQTRSYNRYQEDGSPAYTKQDEINLLFPLSAYHSRWDDLKEIDFHNSFIDTKGSELKFEVAKTEEVSNTSDTFVFTEDMQGIVYLKYIIEECKKRDIPLLLTYLPFPMNYEDRMEANLVRDIANEKGVDYLDFNDLNVVDYSTDFADSNSHLNVSGQKKVSRYLAKYISENYSIEDRRQQEDYSEEWCSGFTEYYEYRNSFLLLQDSLASYLMILNDSSDTIIVEIKDPSFWDNDLYKTMLQRLVSDCDIDNSTNFIIVKGKKLILLKNFTDERAFAETESGNYLIEKIDQKYEATIDGKSIYMSDDEEYSLSIEVLKDDLVFDRIKYYYNTDRDGELISDKILRE